MSIEKNSGQDALTLAKQTLEKIDKGKYPKRYQTQEGLIKALELARNQEIRAKKAEKKNKSLLEESGTPKNPAEAGTPTTQYSLKDIRALQNVHDDDVERVEKFAKTEGISIPEALANDDLKAILRDREEKRSTANATNTGGSRRGKSEGEGKDLLRTFKKTGELPESDEEIEKLAEAEIKAKYSRK